MTVLQRRTRIGIPVSNRVPRYELLWGDDFNVNSATNWTVNGAGWSFGASGITATGVVTPGFVQQRIGVLMLGHLYKVTLVVDSTDGNLDVFSADALVGTINTVGTHEIFHRPLGETNLLFLQSDVSGGGLTAVISAVRLEMMEPFNADLLPVS